jgi:23S rRNA (cytidine1920-2'-O)/16S rRNA (cytidine1409-2'-O)-methyltransferase
MDIPGPPDEPALASRGGLKLQHALETFASPVDPAEKLCADFGCSTGGFTDVLLRAGAARVIAIDTAYGVLDYRLRMDQRVTVRERTNALHAMPPEDPSERPELVTIDTSWTPQRLCVPAALRWLKRSSEARIITLVKPHYEAKEFGLQDRLRQGVLAPADAELVLSRVLDVLPGLGVDVLEHTRSPIEGGKKKSSGNVEYLVLLSRTGE